MKITNGYVGADVNISMSSRQGSIESTYDDLVKVFGPPQFGPNDDMDGKVSCEWTMRADCDGKEVVATIHDWKNYKSDDCEEVCTQMTGLAYWSVGDHDIRAVKLVKAALEYRKHLTTHWPSAQPKIDCMALQTKD